MSADDFVQYLPHIDKRLYQDYLPQITPTQNLVVQPGSPAPLLNQSILNQEGMIMWATLEVNSAFGQLDLIVDGQSLSADMDELYNSGVTEVLPKVPFIVKWDNARSVYAMAWFPVHQFNNDVVITFKNQGTTPMTVLGFTSEIYIFNEGFYEALEKAKYSQQLAQLQMQNNILQAMAKQVGVPLSELNVSVK